jgi:D-cysteine desulfhydrase
LTGDRLVAPLALGHYPTPVERVDALSTAHAELWVKRDDLTHDVYGGNKVRKLEYLLAGAAARGAKRIVTVGAAGSHHVLATTYFGTRQGFDVEAIVVPQRRTDHVVEVLRAALALGVRPVPVRSWGAATLAALRRTAWQGERTCFFALGGSSVLGSMGYVAAARELAAQVREGRMPEPDHCVVALGSGGTAAGLATGFAAEGLKTRVVGVCISRPTGVLRALSTVLARACATRTGHKSLRPRLTIDTRFLGAGYDSPTAAGEQATRDAAGAGLVLDPTYTAKAFASALWHVRAVRGRVVLYWHTFSSAGLGLLLEGALEEARLPAALKRLLLTTEMTMAQ